MPLEQTVTIVNNSGKIISTGKQLLSIFKEAKASYNEKKAEIKALRRAQTVDQSLTTTTTTTTTTKTTQRHDGGHHRRPRTLARHATYEPGYHHSTEHDQHSETGSRRRSRGAASEAGRARSRSKPRHQGGSSRPGHHRHALTASNLRTLSDMSSSAPSEAAPAGLPPPAQRPYRSPYAETLPKDSRISWMNLTQCGDDARMTAMTTGPDWWQQQQQEEGQQSTLVPRRRSEPGMATHDDTGDGIDMHLAYGDVPPDLADRVDLDPALAGEYQAKQLVRRVERLLDEAHCVQHSATAMIKHLQETPDAAAAVALTLAELSSAVANMSPSFIGLLRTGSPAVFALLASPQFLIGTGIAVGLTVVMFGGWKIVQR
ncbi:hypothetical protein E4U41_007363, partial [Claviceps citrina]